MEGIIRDGGAAGGGRLRDGEGATGGFCGGCGCGCGGAAGGLVFDLGVGVEVGLGVDDLDVLEAGGFEFGFVVGDQQGAGDTADVGHDVVGEIGGERCFEGDVGDGEAAAGLENTNDFLEDGGLVGGKVDHAVGDHAVDGA